MPKARGERWWDSFPIDDALLDTVQGNADRTARLEVLQVWYAMVTNTDLFCGSIPPRVRVTHINVLPNPAEPSRVMGQVICELRAERDMVDEHGNVTVGSLTYLVDMLSTLALVAQGAQLRKTEDYVAVSQSLQFIFHAPAPLGSTIRLDNTCVALAGRTLTARCEVWDVDANRLICSAFHVKMPPSKPKL